MPKFPFTNYHELNLDWILKKVTALFDASEENARTIRTYETRLTAAEQTATSAETAANAAELLADAAATTAGEALSLAGTADAKADSALTAATNAAGAVAGALTTAQEAQQTAAAAVATANDAAATASSLESLANSANQTATAASETAGAAAQTATAASETAGAAAQTATAAQQTAESAQAATVTNAGNISSLQTDVTNIKNNLGSKITSLSANEFVERVEQFEYTDLILNAVSLDRRTSNSIEFDTSVRFKDMPYSLHQVTKADATSSEFRFTVSPSFNISGTQEFEMWLYTENASAITQISLRTVGSTFVKNMTVELKNGWNRVHIPTDGGGNYTDADTTTVRILTYTTEEIDVWYAALTMVKSNKANIILVDDAGYYSFYNTAYPLLKAANIPVTWALDPLQMDDISATDRYLINKNELDILAHDGISEFSFHSYDATYMTEATEIQALYDTVNNIRFLQENGLQPPHIWRAAWFQNTCPNHQLADLEVEASASFNGASGRTPYPFPDKYNIRRTSLHGRTTSFIDTEFSWLQRQHSTEIWYTHGCSNNTADTSVDILNYFISKVTTGVNEGWLNVTTFSRLCNQYPVIKSR